MISVSIVTYNNDLPQIIKLLDCLKKEVRPDNIFVVDNSPADLLKDACAGRGVRYIHNEKNIGYGSANNTAIKESIGRTKYHLVVNPDIFFDEGTLENIYQFMESDNNVGLVMPKVLSCDGSIQYLCKMLPTPYILFMRRFASILPLFKPVLKRINYKYELQFTGYDKIMDVPCLSGCFMFIRAEALKEVGMFDEGYFMYLEDFDLSRRIHAEYRTVYYPEVSIYHELGKGAYKSFRLLYYFISSAVKYFNKWGWFFDKGRKVINNRALNEVK